MKTNGGIAEIITIGNELVTGLVADTNAAVIARFLFRLGYKTAKITSVGDDAGAITSAVRSAMKKADMVVITGGLGPTHDDITKKTLCRFFKLKTAWDPVVHRQVKSFFNKRGYAMPETNRDYAFIPEGAVPVRNRSGAAPGLFFGRRMLVLPGVPREAEEMLRSEGPKLIPRGSAVVREKTFHTMGIGETGLMGKITGLRKALDVAEIAFLPRNGGVSIRIIARGRTAKSASERLKKAEGLVARDIREHIWGKDGDRLEEVVGRLLRARGETLAVAESCTGGWIGKAVTDVAGSSDYFLGGIIAYSNEAKIREALVSRKTIERHGAVSMETATAMARGARKKFSADYALSATGIAGPGGGTKDKPAGLVYIALSARWGDAWKKLMLGDGRESNRERTALEALRLLYEHISGSQGK